MGGELSRPKRAEGAEGASSLDIGLDPRYTGHMRRASFGYDSFTEFLVTLTEAERLRFAADLLEAVRTREPELSTQVAALLDRWASTVAVRSHPQFKVDVKEFTSMIEDGSAFAALDVTEAARGASVSPRDT